MIQRVTQSAVLALVLVLAAVSPGWAQQKVTPVTTLISTATTGDSAELGVEFYNSVSLTVAMSSTGTVQFKVSGNGTTYSDLSCFASDDTSGTPVTSTTASGTFQCNVAAMQKVKVTVSANGGTIVVQSQASSAVAKLKGGGGGGGGGAPTTAGYWVDQANGGLSAERNLGGLSTGLVLNTVTAGVGVPSAYAGTTCTNQVLRLLSGAGAGTCVTLTSAYVDTSIWTGTVSSGLLKASSQGVLAQAVANTDYVTPAGNVATATALAANGANCPAGQYPLGVDASGAVESCTAVGSASIIHTFQALTSSGSISGTHKFVTCDATGGAVAITLPAASAVAGADFQIKKIDSTANACTVTRAGADTIDGATTAVLHSRYETIGVASDGTSAWSVF